MSDVILIAILVAFFALAIALVRVLGRMIDRDTDPDSLADEPPDTGAGLPLASAASRAARDDHPRAFRVAGRRADATAAEGPLPRRPRPSSSP